MTRIREEEVNFCCALKARMQRNKTIGVLLSACQKAWSLHDGDVFLFICMSVVLFIHLSVANALLSAIG